jgi:hypothetical protein
VAEPGRRLGRGLRLHRVLLGRAAGGASSCGGGAARPASSAASRAARSAASRLAAPAACSAAARLALGFHERGGFARGALGGMTLGGVAFGALGGGAGFALGGGTSLPLGFGRAACSRAPFGGGALGCFALGALDGFRVSRWAWCARCAPARRPRRVRGRRARRDAAGGFELAARVGVLRRDRPWRAARFAGGLLGHPAGGALGVGARRPRDGLLGGLQRDGARLALAASRTACSASRAHLWAASRSAASRAARWRRPVRSLRGGPLLASRGALSGRSAASRSARWDASRAPVPRRQPARFTRASAAPAAARSAAARSAAS